MFEQSLSYVWFVSIRLCKENLARDPLRYDSSQQHHAILLKLPHLQGQAQWNSRSRMKNNERNWRKLKQWSASVNMRTCVNIYEKMPLFRGCLDREGVLWEVVLLDLVLQWSTTESLRSAKTSTVTRTHQTTHRIECTKRTTIEDNYTQKRYADTHSMSL